MRKFAIVSSDDLFYDFCGRNRLNPHDPAVVVDVINAETLRKYGEGVVHYEPYGALQRFGPRHARYLVEIAAVITELCLPFFSPEQQKSFEFDVREAQVLVESQRQAVAEFYRLVKRDGPA